jgi:hypothetical protein
MCCNVSEVYLADQLDDASDWSATRLFILSPSLLAFLSFGSLNGSDISNINKLSLFSGGYTRVKKRLKERGK